MNCATHAEREATGYCRNCGKALCPECTREVRGAFYCESCVASKMGGGSSPATQSGPNPGLALALGFIPGLGAVYNGEYIKALIHVLVFGGIIAILSSDVPGGVSAFFAIALGCFCCYMPIDSYRVARARRDGAPPPAGIMGETSAQRPIGAFVLIILGILFLLANFGLLREEWFAKSWPVALIALGVYLLWSRVGKQA
jgi:TM2 domain-containing membrane protein YozV